MTNYVLRPTPDGLVTFETPIPTIAIIEFASGETEINALGLTTEGKVYEVPIGDCIATDDGTVIALANNQILQIEEV